MIIKLKDGEWRDNEGNTLDNILYNHGVDAVKVKEFMKSSEFLVRTQYNSVIKIEKQSEDTIKFTPYYSDKDVSLKFVYLNGRMYPLSDKASTYLDIKTGFLNMIKLKMEDLDYYIEMRDDGLAVIGLINRISSSEFDSITDFERDLMIIENMLADDILNRPNYLSVIKCYDEVSLSQLKDILSNSKKYMKDLKVYYTGIYEFTLLSKFPVNQMIAGDLVVAFKMYPIVSFDRGLIKEIRKSLFQEIVNNKVAEEENIIKGYFKALHIKTDETVEHSERMKRIVTFIGEELLIGDDEFEKLLKMSMIHDIGKLAIEGKIINKPGKLTTEEFDIVKKHTILGYEMMEGLQSYESAREVCLYHHERWDGKGYPVALTGNETPLLVRVVTVADAIDAMASKRVYKNAYSFDYVKLEIERMQGLQFCPQISKISIDIFDKIKSLY